MAKPNLRGRERVAAINSLRLELPRIRLAWARGRQWRLAKSRLDAMLHVDSHEFAPVRSVVDALCGAVSDATGANSNATLLERLAFSLWPASAVDDDEHWAMAWVEIARLADISAGLALDVIDISADDFRRVARRRRQEMRERLLATGGGVYTRDAATGEMPLNPRYAACLDSEVARATRHPRALEP